MNEIIRNYSPEASSLDKKTILVTGAGAGIGQALSLACAAQGATVILVDKNVANLEACYDQIESAGGAQPAIIPVDLQGATDKDYETLANTIETQLGKLDAVVNNAGWLGGFTPLKLYTTEMYLKSIAINLHAPFLLTRACLPLLEQSDDPAIVFSAHESTRAYAGGFGIAKAGMLSLMRILADEYDGDRFIRVNAVDTGPVNTGMRRLNYPGELPQNNPPAEAVVNPYLYFLSAAAERTTGQLYTAPSNT